MIDVIQIQNESGADWKAICSTYLGQMMFENEEIVKIFHGSLYGKTGNAGDLGWIQRDFAIRCVNVLDTQQFDRILQKRANVGKKVKKQVTSLSLAAVWAQYCVP